jgi:hypothetical protein
METDSRNFDIFRHFDARLRTVQNYFAPRAARLYPFGIIFCFFPWVPYRSLLFDEFDFYLLRIRNCQN